MIENLYAKISSIKKSDSEERIKLELYGVVISFLLSTDIFTKNNKIKDFLISSHSIFEEIRPYAYDSRTILIGRVLRIVESQNKLFNYNFTLDIKSHIEKFMAENNIRIEDKSSESKNKNTESKNEKKQNYTDKLFDRFKREI